MVHPEKEEKICQSGSEAALVSPKVTFINEAMENMEKWLNLWIHEMMTIFKKHSGENYSAAKSQKNVCLYYRKVRKC